MGDANTLGPTVGGLHFFDVYRFAGRRTAVPLGYTWSAIRGFGQKSSAVCTLLEVFLLKFGRLHRPFYLRVIGIDGEKTLPHRYGLA